MARLLIIEDDPQIRMALVRGLTERDHAVLSASSGFAGLQDALDERPDLVVLDLALPDIDGQEVLKMIRAVSSVAVIVATARDDEQAVIAALDLGADDYLVKPFGAGQLDARIRAVLRRVGVEAPAPAITVGKLVIDRGAREVRLAGELVELTAREFDLLSYLGARAGQVVTKRELLAEVWQEPYGGADKTVEVHLSWLRRKLGESAAEPRYLHTVRGAGVKIVEP